jgi:hypothetical protein
MATRLIGLPKLGEPEKWTVYKLKRDLDLAGKEVTGCKLTRKRVIRLAFAWSFMAGTTAYLISKAISGSETVALIAYPLSAYPIGYYLLEKGMKLTSEYAIKKDQVLATKYRERINLIFQKAYKYWDSIDDRELMIYAILLRDRYKF